MKTKVMTKQDEIEVLQSLKGDTYFSQFFTSNDIDQMCQNISNDFCIELGCSFNKATEVLAKQLKEAKAEKESAIKKNVFQIIDLYNGDVPEDLYEVISFQIDIKDIINHKRKMNYSLNESEIKYLVTLMNK